MNASKIHQEDLIKLKNHLNEFTEITDEKFKEIKPYFETRTLKKGEYLHKAGRVCNETAYIADGVVRSYFNLDGNDITRFVLLKNNLITALSSYIGKHPSMENLQAVTKTRLLVISREHMDYLYDRFHEWDRLGRFITEQSHLKMEKRIMALIAFTAEERYEQLSMEQPEILKHVPLQYIASILGVKPETLSRIRKKISL